ncbi:hypothetical protein B0H66DRAFT_559594 [Apodospora peruviana]|uniref:Microbial-type PARG catalytic domain-containing protein n=1 Tax=Apodospora peruviana TaxID=516989 RepID=A0AAE0HZW1_9PEZI|nr:hypothetical protein B0H66DRAFT_559594 [Apodospora peruviana]
MTSILARITAQFLIGQEISGLKVLHSRQDDALHQGARTKPDNLQHWRQSAHPRPPHRARPLNGHRSEAPMATTDSDRQRETLRAIAQEQISILPTIASKLGPTGDDAVRKCGKFTLNNLPYLDPNLCPAYPAPATIGVINEDTLNAAIDMSQRRLLSDDDSPPNLGSSPYPAVVNFANRHSPGGGWLNGALAQEEAICYRSSLAMSLDSASYPLSTNEALYSPHVLVVRDSLAQGHNILYPNVPVEHLPVVSVLTVAALYHPDVKVFDVKSRAGSGALPREKRVFARNSDRNLTKDKMRLVLRMAASKGHRMLVLGALGCGVFENPPEDVANCWLEVLREDEFSGNWWRDVCFAVYDPNGEGNYEIFKQILHGKDV